MDRYSFGVELFHLLLQAGLSRRTALASRTAARSASWIRTVTPSSFQVLKYQYTVSHGGKSCGSWRHEQPVRFRYKIASTIRRRRWVAGRPPGRGLTIGAINSQYASVRFDGYDCGSHAHTSNHIDHMCHISTQARRPLSKHVLRTTAIGDDQ